MYNLTSIDTYLTSLSSAPDHERIHRSLHSIQFFFAHSIGMRILITMVVVANVASGIGGCVVVMCLRIGCRAWCWWCHYRQRRLCLVDMVVGWSEALEAVCVHRVVGGHAEGVGRVIRREGTWVVELHGGAREDDLDKRQSIKDVTKHSIWLTKFFKFKFATKYSHKKHRYKHTHKVTQCAQQFVVIDTRDSINKRIELTCLN